MLRALRFRNDRYPFRSDVRHPCTPMTVSSVYSALLFSDLLRIFCFNAASLFNHCRKQNKEIQRFNILFRQQLPVPIFNACPYVNNHSAAHCLLLNDLIIRTICFFWKQIYPIYRRLFQSFWLSILLYSAPLNPLYFYRRRFIDVLHAFWVFIAIPCRLFHVEQHVFRANIALPKRKHYSL